MLGIDNTLIARAKYDLAALVKYSVSKEVNGDVECSKKYTILSDRLSNLIYAIESTEFSTTLSTEDQYCLYHKLFSLIQTNNIPGFVSFTDTTLNGIGHMHIQKGYGKIFIIG